MNTELKAYTLSVLCEDIPGVLSQVARLFSRKGYNIETICAGPAKPGTTRISVVTICDAAAIHQIFTQLSKLLPVISVEVLPDEVSIRRQLMMVKVKADTKDSREDIIQITNVFRGNIVDFGTNSLVIAIVGDHEKSQAFLRLMEEFGVLETAQTGTVALARGSNTIYDQNKTKEEYNYGKNVL